MLGPSGLEMMDDGGDQLRLEDIDQNNDGMLTTVDCPHPYGTPEAKAWVKEVFEPFCHQEDQITSEMREKYGDKVVGAFKGLPLVPGQAGQGEGDFEYMTHKIRITQNLGWDAAERIAGKFKITQYG